MSLRSTGLVVFGSRLVSIVTGLAFVVMVARWLNPSQFGLWEFIIDLVAFAAYPVGILTFWVTRDVARGRLVGKSAIFAAMAMSVGGVAIYLVFGVLTYSRVSNSFLPFLLAALLVPTTYWNQIANSIVAGYRPATAGYSLLVSEVFKLLSAYPLLYVYKTGILGVIAALMVSQLVQATVSTFATRRANAADIRLSEARRWFQMTWLPAISTIPYIIGIADTFIASLAFGTTITGYYQAAFAVASIVGYSTALSSALYPRLLAGGREDLPAITMDFAMLFAIPMAVGASVLAPSILFLFAPKYVVGSLGLVILSFTSLFTTISVILDQTLMGRERVDLEGEKNFKRYLKSDLFFVAEANLIYAVGYNILMLISLFLASSSGLSASYAVGAWATAQLIITVVIVLIKALRVRRSVTLLYPGSIGRYTLVSLGMGAILYFISTYALSTGLEILVFGLRLVGAVVAGAIFYFGVLFLVDRKFRKLVLTLLNIFY